QPPAPRFPYTTLFRSERIQQAPGQVVDIDPDRKQAQETRKRRTPQKRHAPDVGSESRALEPSIDHGASGLERREPCAVRNVRARSEEHTSELQSRGHL